MTTINHPSIDSLISTVARKEALIVATRTEIKQLKEQIQRRLGEIGILANVGGIAPASIPPPVPGRHTLENPHKAAAIAAIDALLTANGLYSRLENGSIERLASQYGYALTTMQQMVYLRRMALRRAHGTTAAATDSASDAAADVEIVALAP